MIQRKKGVVITGMRETKGQTQRSMAAKRATHTHLKGMSLRVIMEELKIGQMQRKALRRVDRLCERERKRWRKRGGREKQRWRESEGKRETEME